MKCALIFCSLFTSKMRDAIKCNYCCRGGVSGMCPTLSINPLFLGLLPLGADPSNKKVAKANVYVKMLLVIWNVVAGVIFFFCITLQFDTFNIDCFISSLREIYINAINNS